LLLAAFVGNGRERRRGTPRLRMPLPLLPQSLLETDPLALAAFVSNGRERRRGTPRLCLPLLLLPQSLLETDPLALAAFVSNGRERRRETPRLRLPLLLLPQSLLETDPLALALCTSAGHAMWVASDNPMLDELAASIARRNFSDDGGLVDDATPPSSPVQGDYGASMRL
jgi:hypothetical protein